MTNRSKQGRTPKHVKIADSIRSRIEGGELTAGSLLAPEEELARRHGVSRPVVRQAMQTLTNEGLITRTAGKGTFVQRKPVPQFDGWLISSVEDLLSFTVDTKFKLLTSQERMSDDHEVKTLGLGRPTHVAEIRGLRMSGQEVIILQKSVMPLDIFESLKDEDFAKTMLLPAIEKCCELSVSRILQSITAVMADGESSKLLGIAEGASLLQVERLLMADGRAILLSTSKHRCDRYQYITELKRSL